MADPVEELRLPRLPSSQADWSALQVWWQKVVEQIEATVLAINENITDVSNALAAAIAAQATADTAQNAAIAAAADAAAAQTTANGALLDLGTKVSKSAGAPWDAATGTAARTTFATFPGQTISAPPTQAQVQAIDDHLVIVSRRMKALIDDLRTNEALTP